MIRTILAIIVLIGGNAQVVIAGDITGIVTLEDSSNAQNCVVYISKVNSKYPVPDSAAVMDQVNLEFRPHVLPIVVGTQVDFLNSDELLHNVFTPNVCGGKLDLGTWPKGEKRSYVFQEQGCVSVMLCNVHPEMEAWVLVLQNPYYTRVQEDGSYLIANVPPGDYELIAWHEQLNSQTMMIHVPETGMVQRDILLTWR